MDLTTCYCLHPQCTHYGTRGFDAHLVRCGADRGIPRLLCTICQGTFSVRQGTAYFGVRAEEPNDTVAMRALEEGNAFWKHGQDIRYASAEITGSYPVATDSKSHNCCAETGKRV